jgi:uncharacterized protein (DUF1330 family)
MNCYIIATIMIRDREEYQKYLDGFDEIFEKYKGMIMAVEEEPVVLEGVWPFTRTVLIRFPSEEEARRWFESPEYTQLKQHRLAASDGNIVLVRRR